MTQAAEQRRRSYPAPTLHGHPDHTSRQPNRSRARYSNNPVPTTFVTLDRPSHLSSHVPSSYPASLTVQRPSSVAPPTFSEFSHAMPHTDPVRRTTYRDSPSAHPPLKRLFPEDSLHAFSAVPTTPAASQSTRNEHVNAANVLSSLSRAPSTASLFSASPAGVCQRPTSRDGKALGSSSQHHVGPRSCTPENTPLLNRAHHPTKSLTELEEEEAQANAAELMLFLAAGSPSPARRLAPAPQTPLPQSHPTTHDAATARRLFGNEDSPCTMDNSSPNHDGDAVAGFALSTTSSQLSSRSANSTMSSVEPEWLGLKPAPVPDSSLGSYCSHPFEDLLQLASMADRKLAGSRAAVDGCTKAAKQIGRGLVRTQTQPVVGGEANSW